MSFSSSICITNIGTLPLGCNVSIYSDTDNYTSPFQIDIPLSQLTSNCPYILTNIPSGTRFIKIEETTSHCCTILELKPINLCDLYHLQIQGFTSTTISQIVAGLLVGSVGATITDYIIDWYGPDNNTTIAFTSGYGSAYPTITYQQTHPFTRMSLPGYYVPMIRQIRINGIDYSKTGGAGFIQANIDCLENQTVVVSPSNCVGNRQLPYYTEKQYNNYYFSHGASFNAAPETLEMDFDLSVSTNYFAWSFKALLVSDTIEISFISDRYLTPIVLEYWKIGYESLPNIFVQPKVLQVTTGFYFRKVTNLHPLLRGQNDKIRIKITPNPTNPLTDWDLYFICLDTFDCKTCYDTSPLPYKLIEPSIHITSGECNTYLFSSVFTGCTSTDLQSSNLYKYLLDQTSISLAGIGFNGNQYDANWNGTNALSSTLYTGQTNCETGYFISGCDISCYPYNGGPTTFSKTNDGPGGTGRIYMTFQNLSDLEVYWFSYQNNVVAYGLGTYNDNTNLNYYRNFKLYIPLVDINSINRPCISDATTLIQYTFHTSSQVTTGQTETLFWMNITMPTVSKNISFNNCSNCDSKINPIINEITGSSFSTLNQANFISNVGAKIFKPFTCYQYTYPTFTTGNQLNARGAVTLNNIVNDTIPMSGDSYTLIPSLSSSTCDISSYNTIFDPASGLIPHTNYTKNVICYDVKLISNPLKIQIFNCFLSSNLLIYEYSLSGISANTVTYIDHNAFVGPSMKLVTSQGSYDEGGPIPNIYKSQYCGQPNYSPYMQWALNGLPTISATSYSILCEDIDAQGSSPDGYFVHWSVTGIDPTQFNILQNGSWVSNPLLNVQPTDYQYLPNPYYDDRANGWNGPCPPSGETHHYRIQVTANLVDNTTIKSNYSTFTSTTP